MKKLTSVLAIAAMAAGLVACAQPEHRCRRTTNTGALSIRLVVSTPAATNR